MTDQFLEAIARDPEQAATRLVYADHLEELSDPRAEFLRLDVQWFRAVDELTALRPQLGPTWCRAVRRRWAVELQVTGELRINVIKEVRTQTGLGLKEAVEIMSDVHEGQPRLILSGADLARAEAGLGRLLAIDGAQARLVARAVDPTGPDEWKPRLEAIAQRPGSDTPRLLWARDLGEDPRAAYLHAEIAATRAAVRMCELSRTLDAGWQLAVGRCWAVRVVAAPTDDLEEAREVARRFNPSMMSGFEEELLAHSEVLLLDGVERPAALEAVRQLEALPGVRVECVRSPSRLAWLMGIERMRGASSAGAEAAPK